MIEEALSWQGTPFKTAACEKGFGVNCFGYIFAGLKKAFPELSPDVIPKDYMRRIVSARLFEVIDVEFSKLGFKKITVAKIEDYEEGDVIFIRMGARALQSALALGNGKFLLCNRSHGVIVINPPEPFARRTIVVYRW